MPLSETTDGATTDLFCFRILSPLREGTAPYFAVICVNDRSKPRH